MIIFACGFILLAVLLMSLFAFIVVDYFIFDSALSEHLSEKMRKALEKKGGGDDGRC